MISVNDLPEVGSETSITKQCSLFRSPLVDIENSSPYLPIYHIILLTIDMHNTSFLHSLVIK